MTIIVNPAAGHGKCGELWRNIRNTCIGQKADTDIKYSTKPGNRQNVILQSISNHYISIDRSKAFKVYSNFYH